MHFQLIHALQGPSLLWRWAIFTDNRKPEFEEETQATDVLPFSQSLLQSPLADLLYREETARRLRIAYGTLAVWDCTGRYNLKPLTYSDRVYYRKSYLISHFLKRPGDLYLLDEPLLLRSEAALYLDKTPGTLAVWDSIKRYHLYPIKVGSRVRYSKADLIRFLNDQLKEK